MSKGLSDHTFVVGAGIMPGDGGGSNYPDSLRLRMPKERALRLAIDLLKSVEQSAGPKGRVVEIRLLGKLD
ncbi:hypothetical protein GTP46_26760 [Duganella sp. FT135W]|uniref:Uncharacterized protein n=1 Tax=Duganella flavida TaxID=2692175 RepID=A0A6L8KFQ7_9BURK|nr:hypothetical protein [Duganella flavida]MYM26236.1 hypothetical protein [Duganella flavida]